MSLSQAFAALSISASESIASAGGGSDTHGDSINIQTPLTDGTGVGAAQKVGALNGTAATGGATLDLSALAGGINSANINFSKVKWFVFQNKDTNSANSITLTTSGSNGWTNGFNGSAVVNAGAVLMIKDDQVGKIVDSTHKNIVVTAAAGAPTYHLHVTGEGT